MVVLRSKSYIETMSEFYRIKRIVNSWLGSRVKRRRSSTYEQDDPRMILNDLGLQMSPEALAFVADDSFRREDMLMQLYAAEEELDVDLVLNNVQLDPIWDPKVYVGDGKFAITVVVRREEVLVVEFDYPDAKGPMRGPDGQGFSARDSAEAGEGPVIDVEIE